MKDHKFISRDKPIVTIILLGAFFIAYELSVLSLKMDSPIHFTVVTFVFIALLSYLFWKRALNLLMVWILFVGVFRKWLLPGLAEIIFLFSYIILAGVYIKFFTERLLKRDAITIKHPVNIFILIQIIWAVACMLNPQLPNPLVGVLGVIIHFFYIPMLYIIPNAFNTKEELLKVLRIFIFFSIPLLILGIIQFFSPADSLINKYVSEVNPVDIALVGNFPRITSTFAYLSGYATYLSVLILLIVYLLSLRKDSIVFNGFLFILLGFAILNIMMTGSRGPTIFTFICIIFYMFFTGIFNAKFFKKSFFRFIIAGLFLLFLVFYTPIGQKVYGAFMERTTGSEDLLPRLIGTYTAPFIFAQIVGVYGFGIGSTYPGSEIIGGNINRLQVITGGFEEEPERIIVEMGIIGLAVAFLVRILFIYYFWRLYRTLKDEDLKSLALISMLFQIQFLGLQSLFFNHTTLIFYWFILSFLFLLPKLDKKKEKPEDEGDRKIFNY